MSPDLTDTGWPWSGLELSGPTDEREVKRAYARRLKAIDRSDVEAFERLRRALEEARELARQADGAPQARARPAMADLARKAPVAERIAPADPPISPPPPEPVAERPARSPERLDAPPVATPVEKRPADPLAVPPVADPAQTQTRTEIQTRKQIDALEPPPEPSDPADDLAEIEARILAALRAPDPSALSAALHDADALDRVERERVETTLVRALHATDEIDPANAATVDAVFEWSTDALTTRDMIHRTVGNSSLYTRFVGALPAAPVSREPSRAAEEALDPDDWAWFAAFVCIIIHTGIQTWQDTANSPVLTFIIVLLSTLALVTLIAAPIAGALVVLRAAKRTVARLLPARSAPRRALAAWDRRFTARKLNVATFSVGVATLLLFTYTWIIDPFVLSTG